MERHEILEAMSELKLYGMRASFDEIAGKGFSRRDELYPLLASLIRAEHTHRQARSITYRMSGAKFPVLKDLDKFVFADTPVDEGQVRELATGAFLDAKRNAMRNNTRDVKFMLAAGNAGIEAATNIVVKDANLKMLLLVYGAVFILCMVTFRSFPAVICAILPLALTSVLCEALMVWLGIGVKVATLPVIALGVGVGVDYALYILTVTLSLKRAGANLSDAYYGALKFTGRVVVLTGFTLGVGVATWAFSPIKFQSDMGVLLAFMFVWNMIGALVILPCLASFLLRNYPRPTASASFSKTK